MGSTPLSAGLSRSMATIASSISLPMVGLLGAGLEVGPAGLLRHPEDVRRRGTRPGLPGRRPGLLGCERGVLLLEGVGDVLEEDQAEDDVLVLGRVHVVAQLVGGGQSLASKPRLAAEPLPFELVARAMVVLPMNPYVRTVFDGDSVARARLFSQREFIIVPPGAYRPGRAYQLMRPQGADEGSISSLFPTR